MITPPPPFYVLPSLFLCRLSIKDVGEGGALQLIPTFSQCVTTLSAAYLGWLSAGP